MILFRIVVAVLFVSIYSPQTSRSRISKAEDLPPFSYPIRVSTAELLASDSAYRLLAGPLRADLDTLLRDYEISDKATLIHLLSCRYELEANAGDYGPALRHLLQARDLQQKPGQKLAWRIDDETAIRARSKVQSDDSAWQQAFNKEFRDKLAALPWGEVETDIKDMKAEYQLSAPKVVVSRLTASLDPIIQRNHAINFDHACRIVDNRNWVHYALRLRTNVIEILGSYVSAHRQPQPDIWVGRNFDLTDRDPGQPVAIGIWDGGVDLSVFPRQLASRAKGPSYDFDDNPSSDLLLPLDPDLRLASAGNSPVHKRASRYHGINRQLRSRRSQPQDDKSGSGRIQDLHRSADRVLGLHAWYARRGHCRPRQSVCAHRCGAVHGRLPPEYDAPTPYVRESET